MCQCVPVTIHGTSNTPGQPVCSPPAYGFPAHHQNGVSEEPYAGGQQTVPEWVQYPWVLQHWKQSMVYWLSAHCYSGSRRK
jgi:hypothetical protein